MKLWIVVAVVLMGAGTGLAAERKVGDVVFKADFEGPDAMKEWKSSLNNGGSVGIVKGTGGSNCLEIQAPRAPGQKVRVRIPEKEIAGLRLTLSAKVKAQDVAPPAQTWQGVKVMLYTNGPSGPKWQSPSQIAGTFDFKTVSIAPVIPADITEAWLDVGIEQTTGTVWIDDIALVVTGIPRKRPAQPAAAGPVDRRTTLPRLRGVMYGPNGKAEDLEVLAKWNVNHIRWQLHWVERGKHDLWRDNLEAYDKWLNEKLDHLDTMLPLCQKHGIQVLIDLHTPPGGGINLGSWTLFEEKKYQDHFIKVWDRIATRYKGNKTVWGYDLANEPIEGAVGPGCLDWRELSLVVSQRIRKIDAEHAIVIETGPSGSWGNMPFFEPLPVPGIVYSPHMYEPGEFTHQGVHKKDQPPASYPGKFRGVWWDKAMLKKQLEPVRQYQLDYNVPIYFGEFSAIRWAPGDSARQYLQDVIEIFEEYGWDWAYHAFREWEGWSVEHDSDRTNRKPATQPTSRQKLLMEYFGKNRRAGE